MKLKKTNEKTKTNENKKLMKTNDKN